MKSVDMKKIIYALLIAVILGLLIYGSLFGVNEGKSVILTQWGKPIKTIKEAGLRMKWPWQKVNSFDNRINCFEAQTLQLLLEDKNPIIVTCYIAWKIDNPEMFFQSLNNVDNARLKLGDMVNSQLGIIISEYKIEEVINTVPENVKLQEIYAKIQKEANTRARDEYGIRIVEVGMKKILYPPIVSNAVYQRMKAERTKEAVKYVAEGEEEATKIRANTDREAKELLAKAYKEAEEIKGEGDKEALRIYANAYSKDPEFFRFLKSLQVYSEIMDKNTTLVLSTDSELFEYLNSKDLIKK
ncbi:MAG: protease modulator HflC [Acidobacteria bacterium]|nr:protease modulator HflC [Acidobacteriota bacterium]